MTTALWTCVLLLGPFGDAVFGLPHVALFNFLSLVLWTLCLAHAFQQENTKNSTILTMNSWTFLDSKRENLNLKEFNFNYLFIIYSLSEPLILWFGQCWNEISIKRRYSSHTISQILSVLSFFLFSWKKNFDWSNILSVRRLCPVGSKAKTLL